MPIEPVSEQEIHAYMDAELDAGRAAAVEAYLARHPVAAAQLMRDLHIRSLLRLVEPPLGDAPDLAAAARRLGNRLSRRPWGLARLVTPVRAAAVVSVASLIGLLAGLTTNSIAQAAPPYVADAVAAFRTGLLRAQMPSQVESRMFDPRDLQRRTSIRVPTLPPGWQVTDVQLFPSTGDGPALQIMVRTDAGKIVSIFAVRNAARAPARPLAVRHGATSVAYWRNGDIAYALTGIDAPAALDLAAEDLADNRLS